MSGTVLSTRTGRHSSHSSSATRPAAAIRRTATAAPAPPVSPPVALAPPPVTSPFATPTASVGAPPAEAAESAPPAQDRPVDPRTTAAAQPSPAALLPASLVEAGVAGVVSAGSAAASPALTVTLAIPLTGEALTPQAYRLLDALRELVEMGQGTVVAAPAEPRCVGDDLLDPPAGATWVPAGTEAHPRPEQVWAASDVVSPPGVDPFEVQLLTASRQVNLGGEPLAMTRLEFDLLLFLAGNPRRVFTRAQLLGAVWGYEHTGERTVDVHVRRLRVKMGVHVPLITTVYGVGYRLDDDARIVVVAHH